MGNLNDVVTVRIEFNGRVITTEEDNVAGPPGPQGATGPTGPAGPAGAGAAYSERGVAPFTNASSATGYTYFDVVFATSITGYVVQLAASPTNIDDGNIVPNYTRKAVTGFRIHPQATFLGEISWVVFVI